MELIKSFRQQWLEEALSGPSAAVIFTTVRLWEQLAPELISIIGIGGFKPLYTRAVRLTAKRHAWLLPCAATYGTSECFASLAGCLEGQDVAQARQASLDLFTIFLDVLASLIGEELTTHLLHSAWSTKISEIPAKDLPK